MKREHPYTPSFFYRVLLLLTPLGGDVIFLTPMGVVEKTTTPAHTEHPPQTHKTAPRIEQQGTGRVFLPQDDSRPLQGQ
ncbi:hypothetical protein P1001_46 [Propionibacterium phage P100_1]|uniref:Uncharacterized protein n=1 Tax=Propionibacterium phage P100_1 TaxID=1229791 RepID=K4HNE8_9CAUD|nr:hypothetical protein D293_gp46 [Propionibacterium phage P100_1]AFT97822.1 hypothetical protein P1001_46 [Propionibacterium phage P100_1]